MASPGGSRRAGPHPRQACRKAGGLGTKKRSGFPKMAEKHKARLFKRTYQMLYQLTTTARTRPGGQDQL